MSTANAAYDHDDFYKQVIQWLGFDPTDWRMNFFRRWGAGENTGAAFNPLATTQPGGIVPAGQREKWGIDADNPYWNDNGNNPVKNYVNVAAGVRATAQTLLNGYYPLVLASLKAQAVQPGAGNNVRTWGTTAFAEELDNGSLAPVTEPTSPAPSVEPTLADVANSLKNLSDTVGAQILRNNALESANADLIVRINRIDRGDILGPPNEAGENVGYNVITSINKQNAAIHTLEEQFKSHEATHG